jgi:hypothetical protein
MRRWRSCAGSWKPSGNAGGLRGGRAPEPAHAEAFDIYHCRSHGTRRLSRGELRQEAREETVVYVCTLCGQVADPTPLF